MTATTPHRPPLGKTPAPRAVLVGSRGYTLLELAIVMGIVGAISTVGLLRYSSSLARYRVEAAASRMVADIRLAQSTARMLGASNSVTIALPASRYMIGNQPDIDTKSGTMTVRLAEEPTRSRIVAMTLDGVAVTPAVLTFDGFGQARNTLRVRLQSGSVQRDVVVELGGRAYVATP